MTLLPACLLAVLLLLPVGGPAGGRDGVLSCAGTAQQDDSGLGVCQMDLGIRGQGTLEWNAADYHGGLALKMPGDALLLECIRSGGRGLNPLTAALLLFGLLILPGTVAAVMLAVVISFASQGLD